MPKFIEKTKTEFKIEIEPAKARTVYSWIKNRGGAAKWKSIDLGDPGASCSTPVNDKDGKPYGKPHWKYGNKPEIVTSADEIGVFEDKLFKAVPVRLKRGSGFSLVLADSSQRNIDRIMARCRRIHGDAFYRKGVLEDADASIGVYYTTGIVSLTEWILIHGEGTQDSSFD